tara:strand:+ start:6178 stop:6411 length:234 start_codon:yes stop_codon:yes gene_type:complete
MEKLKEIFNGYDSLAQVALKSILLNQKISVIIPIASMLQHIHNNMSAENIIKFSNEQLQAIQDIYEPVIKTHVHDLL